MQKSWRRPLLLSGIVLLSQAFPLASPVRDVVSETWARGYTIHFPFWHIVFTPFCGIADFLTILSLREAGIFFIYLLGVFFFFCRKWPRWFIAPLAFVSFLAWGAFVSRPMAKLIANDPDILLIDFHSHTQVSHDGRKSFTPEANMAWHREQGYGAAFITDHNRIEASQAAKRIARATWRETGYRSLEGEEASLWKTHLVVLSAPERIDNHPYDSDPAKIPVFIRDMHHQGHPIIASLPEYWFYHWGQGVQDFVRWGIDGFELVNSAPKALDFPPAYRRTLVALCRDKNLFVTGISDNHGYGYATAVWNAIRLPGWQRMNPDQLEWAVLNHLRNNGFRAVQVLQRIKYFPENTLQLLISPVMDLWLYWRSLQSGQALSWVGWIWGLTLLTIFLGLVR